MLSTHMYNIDFSNSYLIATISLLTVSSVFLLSHAYNWKLNFLGSNDHGQSIRSVSIISELKSIIQSFGSGYFFKNLSLLIHKEYVGYIGEIYVFPIKSLNAIKCKSWALDDYGMKYDRKYMLATLDSKDKTGGYKLLSQRECPKLSLTEVTIDELKNVIQIKYSDNDNDDYNHQFSVPLNIDSSQLNKVIDVTIWGAKIKAFVVEGGIPEDFKKHCNLPESTVLLAPKERRPVTRGQPELNWNVVSSFQDYFPIHLITKTSLNDLNQRLQKKILEVSSIRFRPNFVIYEAKEPYMEDIWKTITISSSNSQLESDHDNYLNLEHTLYVNCRNVRCSVPNVDPLKGAMEKTHEPYKTLQSYRRVDPGAPYHPCFGVNATNKEKGYVIHIGDKIYVTKKGDHYYIPI